MANTSTHQKSTSWIPLYISITIIAGFIISYFTIPDVKSFFQEVWNIIMSQDQERFQQWVEDFGWLGPVVVILTMVVQMFLIIVPTIFLMVVTILAYGPVWGRVLVLLAVYSASSVGYIIGRYFGNAFIRSILGGKTERSVTNFLEDYGFWAVFITRLNPFLSNDAISFVAGLLRMPYWKFIGATMAGIAPLTLAIAILGEATDQLKSGLMWGSGVSLFLFILYIWWDKNRK